MIDQGRPSNVASNRCATDEISCCVARHIGWPYDFRDRQKPNDGVGTEMAIGLLNRLSSAVPITPMPSGCSAKSKAGCGWRALSVSRTRRRYEILHRRRGDDALHSGLGEDPRWRSARG